MEYPELKVRCSMLLQKAIGSVNGGSDTKYTAHSDKALPSSSGCNSTDLLTMQAENPHLKYLNDKSREPEMLDNRP